MRRITVLQLTVICLAGLLLPVAAARSVDSQKEQKRPKFGSSLNKLRWDPVEKRAVDKSEKKENKKEETGKSSADDVVADAGGESIKLQTVLVALDVLVTDKSGRQILTNLTKNDFSVTEDGQPQQVETFSTGEDAHTPCRIILILDHSGSEAGFINSSVDAAEELVNHLRPNDEIAVATDDVELLVDFTDDRAKLKAALDRMKSARDKVGKSRQFTALFASLRELVQQNGKRTIIIFQTDGDEAPWLMSPPGEDPFVWGDRDRKFDLADIFRAAEHSPATIYSIIPSVQLLGVPPDQLLARGRELLERNDRARFKSDSDYQKYAAKHPISDRMVRFFTGRFLTGQRAATKVAEVTGGWAAYLNSPDQASAVYRTILRDIQGRYTIGYYPANGLHDGTLRHVNISIKDRPDLVIHGRTSYFAPEH